MIPEPLQSGGSGGLHGLKLEVNWGYVENGTNCRLAEARRARTNHFPTPPTPRYGILPGGSPTLPPEARLLSTPLRSNSVLPAQRSSRTGVIADPPELNDLRLGTARYRNRARAKVGKTRYTIA